MTVHFVIPDTQVRPGCPTENLEWIGRYILERKPDVIIHLGDHYDMESLSSYDRGKLAFEGRRYKADIESGNAALRLLDYPLDQFNRGRRRRDQEEYLPRKVFLIGNHECFDTQTRVVTPDGLKTFDCLSVRDEVLSVNDNGVSIWEPIQAIHHYSYNGDMLMVGDTMVTPNHRIVGHTSTGKWKEALASEVSGHWNLIQAGQSGQLDAPITDDEIKLAAWCLTDSGRSKPYGYWTFYQRESKAERVEKLLANCGVLSTRSVRNRDIKMIAGKELKHKVEPAIEFRVFAESGRSLIDPLVDNGHDALPTWIASLSDRQFEVFLREWQYCDGTLPSGGDSIPLYLSRGPLREQLRIECARHGFRATEHEYRPGYWRLNIVNRLSRRLDKLVPQPVPYHGDVWCVTVPSGRLFVDRNGSLTVSGNSRIDRAVQENGHLDGLIGYHDFDLERRGWEVYDFLEPIQIDGIFYAHYFVNTMTGKPLGGQAITRLKNIGVSFTMGHAQTLDYAIRFVAGRSQHALIAGACLTPDHRVLTADLRYVPLKDIGVGDQLVSFDEEIQGRRGRRYKTGTVYGHRMDEAPVWAVTLSNGKVLKVTEDHIWLTRAYGQSSQQYGGTYRWRTTAELRKGTRIPHPLDDWETLRSREAGYLAGIYDGEGCYYTRKTTAGYVAQLSLSQKKGGVLDRSLDILESLVGVEGITHTNQKNVSNVRLRGGLPSIAKMLGQVRPERLLDKFQPEHLGRVISSNDLSIVSIEPIGIHPIVRIGIDRGTMIVEGTAQHNCYLHDEKYKGAQGNAHWRGIIVKHQVENGSYDPMFVSLDYLCRHYEGVPLDEFMAEMHPDVDQARWSR